MYNSDNNDEVLRCPYNKYHFAPKSRFQRHLVKCEKNYPPDYKVICPYNATHRLSKSEIGEHINTCPMRNIVEASYIQSPSTHNMKPLEECKSTHEIDSDMFWESQEDIRKMTEIPLNSIFKDQTNGSINGDIEWFDSTMNIEQDNSLHHYREYLSNESIRDNMESIGRGRMSSNAEYYKRFMM
ncbi:hypothetical protein ACFW04_004737 [Cataglyphis niger]